MNNTYLGLELLEFLVLLRLILLYFLLGLIAGLPDALRPDCCAPGWLVARHGYEGYDEVKPYIREL